MRMSLHISNELSEFIRRNKGELSPAKYVIELINIAHTMEQENDKQYKNIYKNRQTTEQISVSEK